MREHLIFYDASCPFCNFWVQMVLKIDARALFKFAPLTGKTAKRELQQKIEPDTLILLQDYGHEKEQQLLRSKAVFRIFWLLGGLWAFLGIFSFLPGFCFDWLYRLIAKNRGRFFTRCKNPTALPGRFLD